jgi:CHAT domain-containing protein
VVVADPQFDLIRGSTGHGKRSLIRTLFRKWYGRSTPASRSADAGDRFANEHSPDARRKAWHFERLPGTRIEGEIIAGMLKVPLWHGPAALEQRLKERPSPRLLHLATHGYFLKDPPWYRDRPERYDQATQYARPTDEPLLRSGLALAGANHAFTPDALPKEAEDGLLTAEDVAGLDLEGTDLVVLSACETGLGEVTIGEGVIGLRRAFVLAGAQSIIMSLWKVADLPTAILMSRLYKNLIEARMARDEALREAQRYLRELTVDQFRNGWLTTESIGHLAAADNATFHAAVDHCLAQPGNYRPFDHPYFWAAFILLGATAPLRACE